MILGPDKNMRTAVAQWLRCFARNRKVAGSIPDGVIWFFVDIKSFRSHYCPGVDSASNRNEYQELFLGGKGGRCVRLAILPPSCAVVMKSGNLNFLEPSGPLQVCNGTALSFTFACSICFVVLVYLTGRWQSSYDLLGFYQTRICFTNLSVQWFIPAHTVHPMCKVSVTSLWRPQTHIFLFWHTIYPKPSSYHLRLQLQM